MKNSRRGEKKAISIFKNKITRYFLAIVLVAFVFYAGNQFGAQKWYISAKKPVSANKSLPAHLDYSSVDEVYQALKNKYDGKLD